MMVYNQCLALFVCSQKSESCSYFQIKYWSCPLNSTNLMLFLFISGASATSLSEAVKGDFNFVVMVMSLWTVFKRQQTASPLSTIYDVKSKEFPHIISKKKRSGF